MRAPVRSEIRTVRQQQVVAAEARPGSGRSADRPVHRCPPASSAATEGNGARNQRRNAGRALARCPGSGAKAPLGVDPDLRSGRSRRTAGEARRRRRPTAARPGGRRRPGGRPGAGERHPRQRRVAAAGMLGSQPRCPVRAASGRRSRPRSCSPKIRTIPGPTSARIPSRCAFALVSAPYWPIAAGHRPGESLPGHLISRDRHLYAPASTAFATCRQLPPRQDLTCPTNRLTPHRNERLISVKLSPVTPTTHIMRTHQTVGQKPFETCSRIATHSTGASSEHLQVGKSASRAPRPRSDREGH